MGQNMKCSIEKTGQILLSWSIWNKYEKKRGKSHENDNPVLHRKRRKIPNAPPTEIHMEYPFGRADEMTHIVMCMKCDKIGS